MLEHSSGFRRSYAPISRAVWRAVPLAFMLAACGGRPPTPSAPTLGPTGPAKTTPGALPLPTLGRFHSPGLDAYAAIRGLDASPLESSLRVAFGRALQPPPALDCAAREYAARFAADARDPDPRVARAIAHHCGLWVPPLDAISVTGADIGRVTEFLRSHKVHEAHPVYGIGAVAHPDGRVTATIAALPSAVRIEPLPRHVAAGDPVTFRGRLLRGAGPLVAVADGGNGPVTRHAVTSTPTGEFEVTITVPPNAPVFRVELAREEGRFLRSVGLFELRSELPDHYRVDASPQVVPDPTADDHDARQRALAAAIDRQRRTAGLAPLLLDRRLGATLDKWMERVSTGHSRDAPPGLLDADGWPFPRYRFTFGAGATPDQAVDLLAETPVGRLVLFGAGVDRQAFGVRPFRNGSGFDVVVVAMRAFIAADDAAARPGLLRALNAARARAGRPALVPAVGLDAVAQQVAAGVLSGEHGWSETIPAAMAAVAEATAASGMVGAGALTVQFVDEAAFDGEPTAIADGVRHVGIGVASGSLPGNGTRGHVIVYIVAENVPNDAG